MSLTFDQYGKTRVRIVKVERGDQHRMKEITAEVLLQGDFAASYTQGSNKDIVPTDTLKNLCYILAQQHEVDPIENFGLIIVNHILNRYQHVASVSVELIEHLWDRVTIPDRTGLQRPVTSDVYPKDQPPQPHAFIRRQPEVRMCVVKKARNQAPTVVSRIVDLVILKTTRSSFVGFHKCEHTTLLEAKERNFCTSLKAEWTYNTANVDYNSVYMTARNLMIEEFATKQSDSVQQTLFEMGNACLARIPQIESVHLWLPNIHFPLVDLSPFKLKNDHQVFQPIESPSGFIEGVISRPKARL